MTKAEIVAQISRQSGIEKTVVMTVIESFMENVKESMVAGNEYRSTAFRSSLFNDGDRPGTLEAIGQVNGNSRSYGGFFCRHSDDYAHTQTEQSPHDAPCRNLAEPYKRLL